MKRLLTATVLLSLLACSEREAAEPLAATRTSQSPDLYRVDYTAEALTQQCELDLQGARDAFSSLERLQPPYNVDTVLRPLDQLFLTIENGTGMVFLLSNVHPDAALRQAGDLCVQEFSKLITDLGLSVPLYQHVEAVNTDEQDADTRRYQSKVLRDFRRSGVSKDKKTRNSIRQLNETIVQLGQDFSRNIRDDVRHITVPPAGLDGLPQDFIEQHPVDEDGYAKVTTNYPDVYPYLRYANNDGHRLALYQEFLNRGYPANKKVLKDIIVQRQTLAGLLGYSDYASYVAEDLMVKTPQVIEDFITRISTLTEQRANNDYAQLLAALQQTDPTAQSVGNWQKAYLEERVRKQQYQLDTKVIRQYFHYDNVVAGVFQLMTDLFGVEITRWDTPVWHQSVTAYQVWDQGKVIGRFYLDMHPREGKYGHAAQFGIRPGLSGQQLPVAALVCNFPGENDGSALMEHRQVETFLHEFGHLIHSIFGGQQQWATFSGVATERDFVEAPSQMLEEWIWDYDSVKGFAVNSNGESIPRPLLEKMRAARSFARGTFIQNQMFYAALSLAYYQTPVDQLDLDKILRAKQAQYSPFGYIENTHFYAGFGHLYGYSAAYYTYMWSEVIAADILKQFEQQGMRNKKLANHYRQTILAPGGSKDADQLVQDFLSRPFNFDAFVERLNGAN